MGQLQGKGKRTHAPFMCDVHFAFQINGADPTVWRQAKADILQSIVRTASGRYTVTFKPGLYGIPRQLTDASVKQHDADESPVAATFPVGGYVKNLAITSASSGDVIEVDTVIENAGAAHSVADAANGTWVSVHLVGPIVDERKDAA